MNFLDELRHRDLIQDFSPGLEEHLASDKPVVAYIGFDPTAPSLTIGNYVPIMLLKLFQLEWPSTRDALWRGHRSHRGPEWQVR